MAVSIDLVSQVMIPFTGLVSVYLAGSPNPRTRMYSGICGLLGEPFWFTTAYIHNQVGVMILAGVYAISWTRVVYKNLMIHRGQ